MKPHPAHAVERSFLLSLALTIFILAVEVIGGLWTGSLALLSDAAHVFLDVVSLGLSYSALRFSSRPADEEHTYGFHRFEVFAALVNGTTLALVSVAIFIEAYHRIYEPSPVKGLELLLVAAFGLAVNLVVAYVLSGHQHHDHCAVDVNVKSAFLHVVGDAASSVGVIVAALVIWRTGWTLADPIVSIFIGFIIIISSWRVIRSSVHILMEGVPEGFQISELAEAMGQVPGVEEVHDLHVWNLCSRHVVLSAHVVIADQKLASAGEIMDQLKLRLHDEFGVEHTTIQFECQSCGQGTVICDNHRP